MCDTPITTSPLLADLRLLVNVMFAQRAAYQRVTYYSLSELEEFLATETLTYTLAELLNVGKRRGIFLSCITPETQYTGTPVYQYAYNPDMLLVNRRNASLFPDLSACFGQFATYKYQQTTSVGGACSQRSGSVLGSCC